MLTLESLQFFIPTARGRNFGVEKNVIDATISILSEHTLHRLVNLIGYTHNFTKIVNEIRIVIPGEDHIICFNFFNCFVTDNFRFE